MQPLVHDSDTSFISQVTKFLFVLLITTLFLSLGFLRHANAQESGISIKPANFDETIEPGTQKPYAVAVQNLSSAEQKFYVFTRNISGIEGGKVPVFAESNSEKTGYELADWIELPFSEVVVPPNGSISLDLKLNIPANASPGSHFGGVFISVDPPEIERSGAAVGYQVAHVVHVRVAGDVIEDANIRQFSTSKYLYGSQKIDFLVRIENTGNVLVRPVGPLEIYNMLGNKVGSMMFNAEDQSSVLPKFPGATNEEDNGVRQFEISWEGDSIGFGRYEAILSPVYGDYGSKKTMSSTVSFWILPMNIIGPALGVLAVILLIVYAFARVYIRRSLAHMGQGRRLIQRRRKGGTSATLLVVVVTLTVTALFLIVLLALFA